MATAGTGGDPAVAASTYPMEARRGEIAARSDYVIAGHKKRPAMRLGEQAGQFNREVLVRSG